MFSRSFRPSARLVALAVVGGAAGLGSAQPYLPEVTRWTTQDALDPIEPGRVVFVGSSSIRRWEQLALDFNDYRIVQRGFGGSQFEHLNFWVNELVLDFQPTAVLVWEGTNDITSGEPGTEVFADYQSFVNLVHTAQPDVEIFYIGITPTPSNGSFIPQVDTANGLIAGMAAGDPKLHYIDLPSAFNALNPPSDPAFLSLYVDPVHVNRAGYELWTSVVRPAVQAVVAPNRVYAPNPLTPGVGGRILFDFGPSNTQDGTPTASPDQNGNHWNNWHPAEGEVAINAGEHIGGLVDSTGMGTGVGLVITGGFQSNGIVNGGLLSPDPSLLGDLAVATATQDYFFSGADDLSGAGNDDVPGGFMLTGLDPERVYDLRFFGSRTLASETRRTEYRVTGANTGVAVLTTTGSNIGSNGAYDGNDDTVAEVTGVRPDAFGQVFVDLTVVSGTYAYLNAFELSVSSVSISADPAPALVEAGGTLAFSAAVAGSGPGVALQWERDGVALVDDGRVSGSQTTDLVITGASIGDVGLYRLAATLDGTTVYSDTAVGGVRRSPLGPVDFNNDGTVDADDALGFLLAFDAVP